MQSKIKNLYKIYHNGEIYCYKLYNEDGEEIDSLYDIDDIDSIVDYLPEEFKGEDMHQYFVK